MAQTEGPGVLQPDKGDTHLDAGQHISLAGLSDPPTSGPHHDVNVTRDRRRLDPNAVIHALELGDVILFYGSERPPPALVRLQNEVSGPFDAEVAAAGPAGHPRPQAGCARQRWAPPGGTCCASTTPPIRGCRSSPRRGWGGALPGAERSVLSA